MLWKIAICEDEEEQRIQLRTMIQQYCATRGCDLEITEFIRGEDLLKSDFNCFNLIILDIQLDKINGLETARRIREEDKDVIIVFCSGLEHYAKDGYKVNAFRYLTKPFSVYDIQELLDFGGKVLYRQRMITVKFQTADAAIALRSRDIHYIETCQRKLLVHTEDHVYSCCGNLSKYEAQLKEYDFFRCHRSYLVNIQHIARVDKDCVVMEGSRDIIFVSRNKMPILRKAFFRYMSDMM